MSDILVVSSKIKKFVREKSEFNTSSEFLAALSKKVESICLESIERARADKRKTVKERDLA
jgi:histone H3/H4